MRGNFVLAVRTWCWKCYFKTTKLFVTNFSFERSKQNRVCCPWDISDTFCSRLLLVGPWEIDVPAGFAVPCELNNSVILLPEQVARFCAAGSSHASRVCRPSLPLVPGAKRCCQSCWQLIFLIFSEVAQLIFLNIAGIHSSGCCFLMHSHIVRLICNITKVDLANLTWNNNFGRWEAYCSKIGSKTE